MSENTKQNRPQWWRLALYSWKPAFYRRLIESPLWPALVALLILGLLQGGVLAGNMARIWPGEIEKLAGQWDKQFPKVIIKAGVASSGATKPVTGELEIFHEKFHVVLDTTGATHGVDRSLTKGLLIATGEIVIKQAIRGGRSQQQRIELKSLNNRLGDITLDAGGIRELGVKAKPYYLGNMFMQWMVQFALIKAVHMFLGTIVLLVAVGLTRRRVRYSKLVKLGFYALIPAVTVELFIILSSLELPGDVTRFFFFAYIAIYVGYLVMAVLNLDKPAREPG